MGFENRHRRRVVVCAAALSAAALGVLLLADLSSVVRQERWQWSASAAIVALLLSGAATSLGRRHLRPSVLAPLAGLFGGLAIAAIAGSIATITEWMWIRAQPVSSLCFTVLALPLGAAVGTAIGLIYGRSTAAAGLLSATFLAFGWFWETDPKHLERWHWTLGAAGVAVMVTATLIVYCRQRLPRVMLSALKGLFAGLVAVSFLAVTVASAQWLATGNVPSVIVRALGLAGLPVGAVLGIGLGLVAWLVLPRAPAFTSADAAAAQRPRFQFGLRALLLDVAALGVLLWLAELVLPIRQNYQHERAVNQLLSRSSMEFEPLEPDWLASFVGGRLDRLHHTGVRRLWFRQDCTDDDIAPLEYLTELRKLDLVSLRVTDAGLAYLGSLRELESLDLVCPRVTPEGLSVLAKLPRLRSLVMYHVSDEGLERIARCESLESLVMSGNITDAGLQHLARMKNLHSLRMQPGSNLTGKALAHLAALPNLESLDIDAPIADGDLTGLAGFIALRDLCLRCASVTDGGLVHLEALPSLQVVVFDRTLVTKPGTARLRETLRARDATGRVLVVP